MQQAIYVGLVSLVCKLYLGMVSSFVKYVYKLCTHVAAINVELIISTYSVKL